MLTYDGTLEYIVPATAAVVPGGVVLSIAIAGNAFLNQTNGGIHLTTLSLSGMVPPTFGSGTLPGLIQTFLTVSIPPPTSPTIMGFFNPVSGGGGAAFLSRTVTIGGLPNTLTFGGIGTLPLPGNLRLCLVGVCGPLTGATLPLSPVGAAGSTTTMGLAIGTHKIRGGLWTAGTAVVFGTSMGFGNLQTSMGGSTTTQFITGFAHGPLGAASSTAQASGVVQFVTPSIVTSTQNLVPPFVLFGRLTLHFVPEPSSPLALGSGAAALLALGHRRRRRR